MSEAAGTTRLRVARPRSPVPPVRVDSSVAQPASVSATALAAQHVCSRAYLRKLEPKDMFHDFPLDPSRVAYVRFAAGAAAVAADLLQI